MSIDTSSFYIVARDAGADHPEIPTWASRNENPAGLAAAPPAAVERRDVAGVPGAFRLHGVLSAAECQRLRELSETLGYLEHAAVSLVHRRASAQRSREKEQRPPTRQGSSVASRST